MQQPLGGGRKGGRGDSQFVHVEMLGKFQWNPMELLRGTSLGVPRVNFKP